MTGIIIVEPASYSNYSLKNDLGIYPNPVNDFLFIEPGSSDNETILVKDV